MIGRSGEATLAFGRRVTAQETPRCAAILGRVSTLQLRGAKEPSIMFDELLDLEHRGWRSLCASTGADFYSQVMTSEGVMVLAHGRVLDRQAVIDSLNEAPPWRAYDITDERLITLSDDNAILVYTGHAYREGGEPAFIALMSSVYTRDGGSWRLALYQQTPVPAQS